ncbi:enkurin [Raphidocelis subcapitata]|uniref:Enkurin n=1 Tax=Raphidocelis subcapitata TaxID=307507 RepID=A0A2V0PKJ5_9CHLO|nr:enkurin [Raphidocelis subcapitata]|eukprot:GBG00237.1 enkurin [Raphidocelis subcapitata]
MPSMSAEEEESVYALCPRPQVVLERPRMHRSKFAAATAAGAATFSAAAPRRALASMGRPDGHNADPPTSFLRKHAKEPILPEPHAPTHPKERVKPPVPARSDAPVMGLMSDKDWVVANAVDTITGKPPARTQGGVAAETAKRSGKQPEMANYTQRPGFGMVPTYLKRNKAAIADEQQQIETFLRIQEQADGGGSGAAAQPMGPEERAELLAHLKAKWAAVNAAYLKLGFVLDIESKIKRKEALEAELAGIEADIRRLARGDVVLVVHSDTAA